MSTYEAAYKSLLQGVSQQNAEERLPGQLTAQVNMVSDPVTNLRRRPGALFRKSWAWTSSTDSNILGWFTDIAGTRVHILLNTATGNIRVLNAEFVEEASLSAGAYLTTSDITRIRATSVGSEFFLANTGVVPTIVYGTPSLDSTNSGFFYITAGAFSKAYTVSIIHSGGTATATYTTPDGTTAGDAAKATPEYIANQLYTTLDAIAAVTNIYIQGPYVFVNISGGISITSTTGRAYMITSASGVVTTAGELPAMLPSAADGYVCRVGSGNSPQYYKYTHASTEWNETGAPGSPTSITGVPISIIWTGTVWALDTSAFAGRAAGDDESNPPHEWMTSGITGISTYQGRFVIMSGPLVSLSAAGAPRQFFRTTVSNVLSGDPIETGSNMNSSSAYEWALSYQKDLLLFSRGYQAVMPSGNTAVTPSTAIVVPTSAHEVDTTSSPIIIGRTLMYAKPRSEDFFGVMELLPSSDKDSQYVSQDATPHLPKYMGGRCRFAVSSSVASMAAFAPSGDPYSLIVHEYHWDGDTKAQQAWHQWVFPYPVAAAYFASDMITVVFVQNGNAVMATLDPRAGAVDAAGARRSFLDLNVAATIVDHVITIPAWMLAFDPAIAADLRAVLASGALSGELVGATVSGSTLVTVPSHPSGSVNIGVPYYSGVVPSPPVVKDYRDEVVHNGRATLLRYLLETKNSAEFNVTVSDAYSAGDPTAEATLSWSSPELELGRGLYADRAMNVVPCRTDLRTTAMEVSTEGTGELNITSLEYVAKYHPKIKRR